MLADQRKRPLLQPKRGAFFDPHLGPLGMAAEGRENRDVGIDPQRIIAPVTGRDHAPVKVEDPRQLGAVESGDWAPVPGTRERRDDAQALLAFGCGWRRGLQRRDLLAQLVDLLLELADPRAHRIDVLAARRSVSA